MKTGLAFQVNAYESFADQSRRGFLCIFLFILALAAGFFALCMGIAFRGTRFLALPVPAMRLWWFLRAAGVSLKTQHEEKSTPSIKTECFFQPSSRDTV